MQASQLRVPQFLHQQYPTAGMVERELRKRKLNKLRRLKLGWKVASMPSKGEGIAQWLECWTYDWKVTGLNPVGVAAEFSSLGSTFCADSYFGIRSTHMLPHVKVAHKWCWTFCQKCRWQVTAKHAYTLHMWLCVKWHGAQLYGVHIACAKMAAVSCGTSHASVVKYTTSLDIKKTHY